MPAQPWRTSPLPPGWPRIRRRILARDPVCTWPSGCDQPSTEVDHIGPADDHRDEALRGLCRRHHRERTAAQGVHARRVMAAKRLRPVDRHPGLL